MMRLLEVVYVRVFVIVALLLTVVPVSASAQSEAVEYYGLDAVGSVRVVFDAQGTAIDRMDYGPFGEALRAGIKFPVQQFADLARDAESGQDYAEARNYSAVTSRFNRTDPLFEGLMAPQLWNRYSYAANNPLSYSDPTGLSAECTYVEKPTKEGISAELKCPLSVMDILPRNNTGPILLGLQWVTGLGKRKQEFKDNDPLTERMKKHPHVEEVKKQIAENCAAGSGNVPYKLDGLDGAKNFVKDYSTVASAGQTGSLEVTYFGSFRMSYVSSAPKNGAVSANFTIRNSSSLASAVRPPVAGYSEWWVRNVDPKINSLPYLGAALVRSPVAPLSEVTQEVSWSEAVPCTAGSQE